MEASKTKNIQAFIQKKLSEKELRKHLKENEYDQRAEKQAKTKEEE